jgi:hypothetical protein
MPYTVLIHIYNEDPVVAEIQEMPAPTDQFLLVENPRKRDGKDLQFIQANVTTVIWPWSRINFVELLPVGGEDEIIGFVRE